MICQRCQSARIAYIRAKCDDRCIASIGDGPSRPDYVPRDLGIGGGDYLDVIYCLDCGQMAGEFPLPPTDLEDAP